MRNNYVQSTLLILLAFLISACVTTRQKGELKGIKKVYENTTARYNGYYNADVLLTESRLELEKGYTDNYNKVLPVFPYLANENPASVAGNLDEAIKKVSVVVALHRESDWTDDSYLLLGKAQYLKQDFESAEETMEYMTEEFSPSGSKKRSARRSSGSSGRSSAASRSEREKDRKEATKERKEEAKEREEEREEKADEREEAREERAATLKAKRKARERFRKQRAKAIKKRKKVIAKNRKRKRDKKPLLPVPEVPKSMDDVTEGAPKKKKKLSTEIVLDLDAPDPTKKEKEEEEVEDNRPAPKNIKLKEEEAELNGKPESYFMKHRPAYQEGLLWMAKVYIERENYIRANRLLEQLNESPLTFDDIRAELMPTLAHFYLKREQYEDAVAPLTKAVELAQNKADEARYSYILGQLHRRAGRNAEANAAFANVVKSARDYELAFMAKLNVELSGQTDPIAIRKTLERLAKDEKNFDYRDRIYYAMSEVAFNNGDRPTGITDLKRSVFYSRGGAQKTESYLRLASLYFEDEDFVSAKLYYDSTLQTLPKTDERFALTTATRENLTEIAQNIQIVTVQDSLLRIANLSPDEQRALAAEIRAAEQERKRLELIAKQKLEAENRGPKAVVVNNAAGASKSSWFAYNDKAVRRGLREFQQIWGGRQLEDNWRRSNQNSIGIGNDQTGIADTPINNISDDDISTILKDVPQTEEQKQASRTQILDAMFKLGGLYRDKLSNNAKTVEVLEDMNQRFPGNKYELDSWYYLYLAHTDLGNTAAANRYKQQIVSKYPETTYGRILNDPNYLQSLLSDEQKLNKFYDEVYALFREGQYQQASGRIAKVDSQFGKNNALQARFALLNAMISGNLEGKPQYIGNLKTVIAKFPDTQEAVRARELLRLLGEQVVNAPGAVNSNANFEQFKKEDDKLHYVLVALQGSDVKLSQARTDLSDYHLQYHKLDKFRIASIFLGSGEERVPVLVVRRFKNAADAQTYAQGAQANQKDFLSDFQNEIFIITQNNYRQVLKDKNLEGYRAFYGENY